MRANYSAKEEIPTRFSTGQKHRYKGTPWSHEMTVNKHTVLGNGWDIYIDKVNRK